MRKVVAVSDAKDFDLVLNILKIANTKTKLVEISSKLFPNEKLAVVFDRKQPSTKWIEKYIKENNISFLFKKEECLQINENN